MKRCLDAVERDAIKAALRFHNYRERHTTVKKFSNGGEPYRMAFDHIWDKLDELEKARDAAVAALAKARRKGRRR